MIEIIEHSRTGKRKQDAHPEWESWFEASAYTPEAERKPLYDLGKVVAGKFGE